MRKQSKSGLFVIVAAVLCGVGLASAAPLLPPAPPPFPPAWGWPNGDFNGHWDGVGVGNWPGSGSHWESPSTGINDLVIDNRPNPVEIKHLWFQFDYYLVDGGGIAVSVNSPGSQVQHVGGTGLGGADLGGGWFRASFLYDLIPQPAQETIRFGTAGSSVIDNIYYSTLCTPEPATLSLLSLGVLAVVRRRRK